MPNLKDIDVARTRELYEFTPRRVKESLKVAQGLADATQTKEVIFHFYWRVPKEFGRKQALPLLSSLVTQRKVPTKLWLWSNVDLSQAPDLAPFKEFIEFKIWDPLAESIGTPIEGKPFLNAVIDDPICWLGGDLFRLLCLYKYGGVYIDMDVAVLRDFSPLLDEEFLYQWGSSGTTRGEPELMINGAVMRLKAYSPLAERLILTMNDDIGFDDDYFERAVAELATLGPRSFLVSPGVYQTSGQWAHEAGITDWSRLKLMHYGDRPDLVDHATTRCLFMTWGAVRGVGGFHPTLLPHYTSDYVFTMTAHRRGVRLVPAQTVHARFNDETTGDHGLSGVHGTAKLQRLFSPRFSYNPLHQFFFVWYACPWVYKLPCWARVAITSLKHLR